MKVLVTLEQIKKSLPYLILTENDTIDLTKNIDISSNPSLKKLKNDAVTIGLQHNKGSKTRERGLELKKMLSSIEGLEDKETFEKYFQKIAELISKYKSKTIAIKKLAEIVYDLSQKDINVAKQQIEDIIKIFEDPRFADKHKNRLIKILTDRGNVDLDNFYNETKRAYADYENSFAEGENSPFSIYRTSPQLKVLLLKDYSYNNMVISAREFNSQDSDISKVLYLIEKLISVKIYGDANDIISKIISSLSFTFNFNYSPENVKADLMLRDSLIYEDRITKKVVRIAQKGGLMEIKYKPFKEPSYLSEFFKIDASNVNYSLIIEGLSKIPKITDVKTAFKVFMSSLIGNLKKTMVTTDGEKIIEHLTNNLSGIIFKDNIFIPKSDISFYWNSVGYANRDRLSIWYKVSGNPTIYKISSTSQGFSRYVFKP
jgi:DNA-binding ferritin-like protein (Dps family)